MLGGLSEDEDEDGAAASPGWLCCGSSSRAGGSSFEAASEERGSPRAGLLQVLPLSHQLPRLGTKSKFFPELAFLSSPCLITAWSEGNSGQNRL